MIFNLQLLACWIPLSTLQRIPQRVTDTSTADSDLQKHLESMAQAQISPMNPRVLAEPPSVPSIPVEKNFSLSLPNSPTPRLMIAEGCTSESVTSMKDQRESNVHRLRLPITLLAPVEFTCPHSHQALALKTSMYSGMYRVVLMHWDSRCQDTRGF